MTLYIWDILVTTNNITLYYIISSLVKRHVAVFSSYLQESRAFLTFFSFGSPHLSSTHRPIAMCFRKIFLLSLIFFSTVSVTSTSDVAQLFEDWCKEHGKIYSSEQEKHYRFKVFEDNHAFVTRHNSVGNDSFSLSLNAFADLTHHEFKVSRLGLAAASAVNLDRRNSQRTRYTGEIPASIDWRNKGAVAPVKDQGSCGMLV